MHYQDRERDEFDVLMWVLVTAVAVSALAGLIEFNARRQAAAITREMMRPATPDEVRQLNEDILQSAAAFEQAVRPARVVQPVRPNHSSTYDTRPLDADERCIEHKRFRRLANGWASIGSC